MKKAYINPDTSIVLVTMQAMIAESNPQGFKKELDNDNTITPDDMLSRRRTVWDDEEEEEEF